MSAAITAAVVGAGISAYGANKAKKGAGKAPEPVNIFQKQDEGPYRGTSVAQSQAGGLLGYYRKNVPGFIKLQDQLGPQLMGQMFGQTGQFLGGVGGQPGFNALQLSSGQQAGKTIGQLRQEELGQMTGQAGLARGLMGALSPEQAAAVQASAQEAERARASAQGVSPQERRDYEQQARESFQASGRLGGNLGIVEEAMGRESVLAKKRGEAALAGKRSYDLAQQFYTTPGLAALQNAPLSYTAGSRNLTAAMIGGPESSGSFDYNMPLNLAMSQAGAQNSSNMANYQIASANAQAQAKMYSDIGSSLMGAGFNMAGAGGGTGAGAGSAYTQSGSSPWGKVNYSYV
jgi:hypothetical protein